MHKWNFLFRKCGFGVYFRNSWSCKGRSPFVIILTWAVFFLTEQSSHCVQPELENEPFSIWALEFRRFWTTRLVEHIESQNTVFCFLVSSTTRSWFLSYQVIKRAPSGPDSSYKSQIITKQVSNFIPRDNPTLKQVQSWRYERLVVSSTYEDFFQRI